MGRDSSGRGRGGRGRGFNGRGRGGRGRDNASSSNKTSDLDKSKTKTKLDNVKFEIGPVATRMVEYHRNMRCLLNYIQRTYKHGADVVQALSNKEAFDLNAEKPQMVTSTKADPDEKQREQAALDKEYDVRMSGHIKREMTYKLNMEKAYALLFNHCSDALINRIEGHEDFESSDSTKRIRNNPILLLKVIEQECLTGNKDRLYDMKIAYDALMNLLKVQMNKEEGTHAFHQRMMTAKDLLLKTWGGDCPLVMDEIIKQARQGTTTSGIVTTKERKEAFERFLAYVIVKQAYRPKYGSLQDRLEENQRMGTKQYPTTMLEAKTLLESHPFDSGWNRPDKTKNKTSSNDGDYKKKDQQETIEVPELSLVQIQGHCYCCGKPGHNSDKCRLKDKIPRENWAMRKATAKAEDKIKSSIQMAQVNTQNSTEPSSTTASTARDDDDSNSVAPKWCATQYCTAGVSLAQTHSHLKDWILLDSQSTVDYFSNPTMVENIRRSDVPLHMATNAGTKKTHYKAQVPQYGEVWFDKDGIANIFSLASMIRRHRVVFDSAVEPAFLVYTPKGIVRFTLSPEGLFYHVPNYKNATQHVLTMAENAAFYTKKQQRKAKEARELLHTLACPTIQDLKKMIKMGTIQNCPVTTEDVDIAEAIYGPDVPSLKGKLTRGKPSPVVQDYVDIPPELLFRQHNIDLCVDTFFVNGIPFLSSISKRIMYRTCARIVDRTHKHYRSGLEDIFRLYEPQGFVVARIHGDQEFKSVVRELQEDGKILSFNLANSQEHQPHAERNNRTIQERVRALFHSLPYQALPIIPLVYLVMEAAQKLNFFPPKGGVSPYYSPREIVTGQRLDYNKKCKIPTLSYVLAHDEPTPSNTQAPRGLDCLYLRPAPHSTQGGHECWHLATQKVIIRRKVTRIPVTASVIAAVEAAAKADKMDKLHLKSKHGVTLYESSATAGVDYTEDAIQNDDDPYQDEDYIPEEDYQSDDETLEADTDVDSDEDDDDDYEYHTQVRGQNRDPAAEEPLAHQEPEEPPPLQTRYPTRERRQTERMREYQQGFQNVQTDSIKEVVEYLPDEALAYAYAMLQIRDRATKQEVVHGVQHVITYSLKKGLQKFGEAGKAAALKEMKQLHDRVCFTPIDVKTLTESERRKAVESLIFLTEKKDGTVKARQCANGKPQRQWMNKEESSSPTVSTESTFLTGVIEAEERRDIATCDIPNAFIQTEMERKDKNGDRTVMKIRGALVDILCELDPTYTRYVVWENKGRDKVLYVHVIKALYGLLQSSMLFYQKLSADLIKYGCEKNPYDPCVANKMVRGSQLTVSWHVDDLKVSHKDPEVVTLFIEWIKETYGSIGEVKVTRGKIHDYLGMKLDYSVDGKLIIDMRDYVSSMIEDFPKEELPDKKVVSPWTDNLFKVDEESPRLNKEQSEQFHTTTAQGLFLAKRGRPDISPAIAYFTTRVIESNEDDWKKLVRMMQYLRQTREDRLTLEADGEKQTKWHVDASFAVHPDFRSHTGAIMTMGRGAVTSISTKQKINTRSSTEAEIVGVDDVIGPMMWTNNFLKAQGYNCDSILLQDNESAIKLETNGRASAGKRSRHMNIRYFFVHDMKEKGHIQIKYCPTDKILGDYMSKPLHGKKFNDQRNAILNLVPTVASQMMMIAVFETQ